MNKVHAKRSRIYMMILALVLVLVSGKTPVFAATDVGNFSQLEAEVAKGGEINLTQDITVTETLVIDKNVKISGGTLKWAPAVRSDQKGDQMFKVNEGKTLALKDITLDGDNQGRLINVKGGTVNLENAILQNGSTEKLEQNTNKDQNFSGGAILATKGEKLGSTVTIIGGKFLNNNTGTVKSDDEETNYRYRAAEGGAIKIEDSTLTINSADTTEKATTIFKGNHLEHWKTGGGRQGGSIEATRSKVEIYGATFDVPGPFNTGGAIKFEDCGSEKEQAKVINSSFTILDGKKPVGMAGGAITSEGSYLTIDKSTFKTGKGSYVQESGGLIQVVGTGEFHLTNSELTGSGGEFNKTGDYKTAKYGGAVVFYDDSTVTATIENTTIQNFTAEISGGGIALNTQVGNSGGTNLTLKDTKILNNLAYAFDMTAYGGGIFVGKGNTVTMEGGQISSKIASSIGGAIYNEGNLTLTKSEKGNALIKDNLAYHMAAGVLNDGELTVDYATFSGNKKGDWSTGEGHVYDENKKEFPGVNIYAVKDVTITPNAQFDDKDVRIIEKNASGETSKILLTGPLKRQINVSISEKPKTGSNDKFIENQKRRIGYVVAEGTNGYTATKGDANKLHYLSRAYDESKPAGDDNQPVAKADDYTGTGKWDFVLNKDNGKVVVGQRVKLIYHGNLGKIGTEDKKEKTVDVYKNTNFWEGQLEEYQVADPELEGSSFMGWYFWKDGASAGDTDDSIQNIKIPDDLREKLFDFSRVTFQNNVADTDKIITPNIIHTYAGWSQNISIPVLKDWVDTEEADKVDVTVTLKGGDEDITLTLTKEGNYFNQFEDLSVFTKSYEPNVEKNMNLKFVPKTYSVVETAIDGFTTSYRPEKMVANQVAEVSQFVVTNTKVKTGSVYVKYVDEKGAEIADKTELKKDAPVGEDYSATPKVIDGYENGVWQQGSAPEKGKVAEGEQTVVYVYKVKEEPKTGSVYVKYVDEQGKEISKQTELKKDAPVGEDYTASPKTIDGYKTGVWQENSAPENGKVVEGEQTVVYVYKKVEEAPKTGSVYVKYVDEKGAEIADKTELKKDAPVGEDYSATPKVIDGYENGVWQQGSAPEKGKVKEGEQTVVYVYKKVEETPKTGSVYVKYVDEKGAEIADKTELKKDVPVGEDYIASPKTIDGYETGVWQEGSAPENGKVVEGEQTVVYVYKKIVEPPTETTITKYVDESGNNIIPPKDGEYQKEDIPGYDFVKTTESKTENRKTITHIYKKVPEDKGNTGGFIVWNPEPVSDDGLLNKKDHKAYMFGYPDGNFLPDRNMTREEVTAMFARLLKDYPRERRSYAIPYKDVTERDWSYEAIGFMTEKGIIKGYEDGSFRPKEAISRAEFAAMAARFDKLVAGTGNPFNDVPDTHWAVRSIDSAAAKGWVSGYPDGSFKPERKITRSEVVSITNIMLDRYADKDFVRSHLSEMIPFYDLTEANWAYFPIMEATHGHDYSRKAPQEENWIRLNGEEFRFPLLYRK